MPLPVDKMSYVMQIGHSKRLAKVHSRKEIWGGMECSTGISCTSLHNSDASTSLFRFRYDIDTILTKYRDIDGDI